MVLVVVGLIVAPTLLLDAKIVEKHFQISKFEHPFAAECQRCSSDWSLKSRVTLCKRNDDAISASVVWLSQDK